MNVRKYMCSRCSMHEIALLVNMYIVSQAKVKIESKGSLLGLTLLNQEGSCLRMFELYVFLSFTFMLYVLHETAKLRP